MTAVCYCPETAVWEMTIRRWLAVDTVLFEVPPMELGSVENFTAAGRASLGLLDYV
jgi:hypothetical protein